jgi:hypothetical protein
MINEINKVANQFGYTVVPTEVIERMKNELASLIDAIKIYESKEVEKK